MSLILIVLNLRLENKNVEDMVHLKAFDMKIFDLIRCHKQILPSYMFS